MSHGDADSRTASGGWTASSRKQERDELADRAAEAATALYVSLEHEERKRRFDLMLARAAGIR